VCQSCQCDENATCSVGSGSWDCTCGDGYIGSGWLCGTDTPETAIDCPGEDEVFVGQNEYYVICRTSGVTAENMPCSDIATVQNQSSCESDDCTATVTPTAGIEYYGEQQSTVTFSGNGLIGFPVPGEPDNVASVPSLTMAVYWDDLKPDAETGNFVYYAELSEELAFQWQGPHFSIPEGPNVGYDIRATVVTNPDREDAHAIRYCYVDTVEGSDEWDRGNSATIGINGSGSEAGTLYSYETPSAQEGTVLAFYYLPSMVGCSTLSAPENGSVEVATDPRYADEANYHCDQSYGLSGDTTRTCQLDGTWSGEAPTCVYVPPNYMFVTAEPHDGNLGGLEGADDICQTAADNANLEGTYLAFLSVTGTNNYERFGTTTGWYRADGRPFANDLLAATQGTMFYPPRVDENGDPVTATHIWTGTTTQNCGDWLKTEASQGRRGNLASINDWDSHGGGWDCDLTAPLICFSTGSTQTIGAEAPGTRLAFLSENRTTGTVGLEGLDDVCQTDFEDVHGLDTGRTFKAFIASGTSSAASRITDQVSSTWARPDGVLLGDTPADVLNWNLIAQLTVQPDGDYYGPAVWVGASTPTGAGHGDCGEWQGDDSGGDFGHSRFLAPFAWSEYACDSEFHLYCFED